MEENKLYKCPECGGIFEGDEFEPVNRIKRTTIRKSMDWYMDLVCRTENVNKEDVMGRSRKRQYAYPRHLFCWLVRKYEIFTYEEIGEYLGRDHATVLHACRTVQDSGKYMFTEHKIVTIEQYIRGVKAQDKLVRSDREQVVYA